MTANIIFDLDGTLIDSAPDLQGCANRLLLDEGYAPITLEQARSYIGNGAGEFLRRMRVDRKIPDSEHERLLATFMEYYAGAVHLTRLMDGAVEALATLRKQGHRLGLCTNKPMVPCMSVLKHLGLDEFFDVIIAGDSLPVRKPDPLPLVTASHALGAGPDIYIGDSDVDAETARKALIPFLLYTGGYSGEPVERLTPLASFDRFSDLPSLVTSIFEDAE